MQQLRRKAEERNPDEFYYGMEQARTAGGVHIQRSTEANKYTQDELRLMKTQDVNYLALKAQAEAKVRCVRQRLRLCARPLSHRLPPMHKRQCIPLLCRRKWNACSSHCT